MPCPRRELENSFNKVASTATQLLRFIFHKEVLILFSMKVISVDQGTGGT